MSAWSMSTVVNVGLAVRSGVSRDAGAGVGVQVVQTYSSVLTGVRAALVHIELTTLAYKRR